eukprot:TRINITY_DN112695_c0_g1_i1.p1 TRINITY_DN112695_c0_g1~~TRINITY_DN112695_c0_g1_i1.p1  ORF type:complete len:158 (-),score=28.92 TRINITY_DN112695_c0_g1_i1:60-473(-)
MDGPCKWAASGQCWGCRKCGTKGKGGGKGDLNMVLQTLFSKQSWGGGGGWGKGGGKSKPADHDTSGGILGEQIGTITNIGAKYGFIESDALKAMGYQNVFVLASELRQYQKDEIVKFTAYLNKEGKIRAMDLKSGLK